MGANQLYDNVLKSIDRNISVVETSSTDPARSLHTFVFHPRGIGHFISFAYPTSSASDGEIFRNIFFFTLISMAFIQTQIKSKLHSGKRITRI